MTIREELIAAGLLRPGTGSELTPTRTPATFRIDADGRAAAARHEQFGAVDYVPDGAFLRAVLRQPPRFGGRP